MRDDTLYMGIDFGGTNVKLGLVSADGHLAGKASLPTENLVSTASCRSFAARIAAFARESGVHEGAVAGLGLAVPGIVAGAVGQTPNVEVDWPAFSSALGSALQCEDARTVNDANAAALGELWKGAGGRAESLLLVTLGTGVGGGFATRGGVLVGAHGAAGEIGHVTVVPGGRPCGCGRRGCVEQYASARGVVQTYRERVAADACRSDPAAHPVVADSDALAVYTAARAGDAAAREAFAVLADTLGFALSQVACVVDPAVILIGGGLSGGASIYLDDLREAFRRYAHPACAATEIRCASLLGDAGMYGAARFAMLD